MVTACQTEDSLNLYFVSLEDMLHFFVAYLSHSLIILHLGVDVACLFVVVLHFALVVLCLCGGFVLF